MVDFNSHFKIYPYLHTTAERREPVKSNLDLYRKTNERLLQTRPVQVHDCRPEFVQDLKDDHLWEAFMLKHGLDQTYNSVDRLHEKPKDEDSSKNKKPDKLIFQIGETGSRDGDFRFPRSLAVTEEGTVWVADTMNHRVQCFNGAAVHISSHGKRGSGPLEFKEPSGVAVTPSGDVVIADTKNKRIQVMTSKGKFKYEFPTGDPPFQVACDEEYNIVLSTTKGSIEIYRRNTAFLNRLCPPSSGLLYITVNNKREVIISDPSRNTVEICSYQGTTLHSFTPSGTNPGLACKNTAITINRAGELIIADSLNHCVNSYTERGTLVAQLLAPTDYLGPVQGVAVGPEGHLLTVEYSMTCTHALKVFRYLPCECHRVRPGSSKKRTPSARSPAKVGSMTASINMAEIFPELNQK